MRRLALAPILVCALLSPSTALALGVGEIKLQSALNQPLDAEIPLRGVSSEERDDIVVALASEQAFREVGLERSFSLNRLQFEVASRNGSHYIQVSSNEPITEPFLSFLIEVDSPQGNLLREYTVLLDPPVFASEEGGDSTGEGDGQQPAREAEEPSGTSAAMADGGDMNGRVTDTGTGGDTEAEPPADMAAPAPSASRQREGEFDDTPMFLRIAREEEAAERRVAEQAAQRERERDRKRKAVMATREDAEPAPTGRSMSGAMASGTGSEKPTSQGESESRSRDYGPVREGETLWDIAERLKRGEVTTQQMMLALLRYNPEAFDSRNVNRLKQGYVLRVPDSDEVRSVSAQQAIAQVREQNGLWREWRDSLQQGAATRMAAAQEPQGAEGGGDSADSADSGNGDGDSASPAAAGGDGQLDIVGADEGGATSDESASATASGPSETREQLQLAREELASVRSEKEEMAERVEQLESTVDKMEQLVTVREEQLAQLEQQLAELREETGQSGDAASAASGSGMGDAAQGGQEDAAVGDADATDDEGDMAVADAGGSAGGDGATTAGDSGSGGDNASAVDGAASQQDTTVAGGSEHSANDDGAATQTAASDQQREVVNPASDTDQQERGWLDAAVGFLAGIGTTISGAVSGLAGGGPLSLPVIGGAGVALLALVLLAVRRRRAAQAAADEELMAPVAVGEHHADIQPVDLGAGDSTPAEAVAAATPAPADEPADESARASLMDEELDLSGLGVDPEAATPADEAEQDDTLVEADTYLAYGLHQQAEDLLRLALEEHPERLDYREKLLETLSAAGKSDDFVSTAEEFRNRLDDPSGPAWQRVSAMGRKIAPDHALFASAAAATAGAAMAADDTGATDDDFAFDLDSEPASAGGDAVPSSTEVDLDLGDSTPAESPAATSSGTDDLTFDLSDLEDSAPAAEPPAASSEGSAVTGNDDTGLDFDLGDFGLDDGTQSTNSRDDAADTSRSSDSVDDGLDIDLGDLGIDDSADTTASAESSAHSGVSSAEQDGRDPDLGDFGGPELGDDASDSTPATAPADGNEGEVDLSFDLDDSTGSDPLDPDGFGLADSPAGGTSAAGADAPTADTGADEDPFAGLDDFGLDDSDSSAAAPATGRDTSALDAGGDEDPFAGLEDLGGDDSDSNEFDLSSFEDGFAESDSTPSGPAPAPELGGASADAGDDLATMLDLAKAYIDMGDPESASNALEEVIAGGTQEQRAEARNLLETVQ